MGITEQTLRSYPKPVKVLARKYDSLLRKLDNGTFNDSDYRDLGDLVTNSPCVVCGGGSSDDTR